MNYIDSEEIKELNDREKTGLALYKKLHKANIHKMVPIPVCEIPKNLMS